MIGLDRAFKPEWVYRILRLSEPGTPYSELQEEFYDIIEVAGLKSKKNIMTIVRRYYLEIEKRGGAEYIAENPLHVLAKSYSFDSLRPILLFTLILKSPIVQFIQERINIQFLHNGVVNREVLLDATRQKYGDRRVVKYAVGYYLKILEHFGIIEKTDTVYRWVKKKEQCTEHVLKEVILLYSRLSGRKEIDVQSLPVEISLTYIDLQNLESVLREFNAVDWKYQKTLNTSRIVIL